MIRNGNMSWKSASDVLCDMFTLFPNIVEGGEGETVYMKYENEVQNIIM